MELFYHIPSGQSPEETHAPFYQRQEDGSYLLQVTGLPAVSPDPSSEPSSEPTSESPSEPPSAPEEAANCHGAGAHVQGLMGGQQTIIAPHDSQTIQNSLHAIASGAVRIGS